jgi:hypothetical protein
MASLVLSVSAGAADLAKYDLGGKQQTATVRARATIACDKKTRCEAMNKP